MSKIPIKKTVTDEKVYSQLLQKCDIKNTSLQFIFKRFHTAGFWGQLFSFFHPNIPQKGRKQSKIIKKTKPKNQQNFFLSKSIITNVIRELL